MRSYVRRSAKGSVDVEVLGMRMRLNLEDNACERRLMVTPQFFDPVGFDLLDRQAREAAARKDGDWRTFNFVDVGANIGTYSFFVARRLAAAARIIAIVTNPELIPRVEDNIAHNDCTTVSFERFAVFDKAGELTLIHRWQQPRRYIGRSRASGARQET
jgi:hypothetical protein